MKKTAKIISAAAALTSAFVVGMAASGLVETIQAEIHRDMTIIVDGKAQSFTDANGSPVYPVMYNGTTYLPVRAIGNLMGKDVSWDGSTKTVTLTAPSYNLGGSLIYEDENVELRFKETYINESIFGNEYGIRYTLTNKSDQTITLYMDAIAINGISYNDFYGSDAVAAKSTGIIDFTADEYFGVKLDTFPVAGVDIMSGEFHYYLGSPSIYLSDSIRINLNSIRIE